MKKLILLTLAALVIVSFPNVSEAAKGNIPIAPFQIVQTIAQAIQSAKEPIHNSKPVANPAAKKKRAISRSSSTPSPEDTPSATRLAEELVRSEGAEASEKQPEAQHIDLETLRAKADSGDADSQYQLGLRYRTGTGVGNDFAEGVKWFRKAAEQNCAPAQNSLALSYRDGKGVGKNFDEALKWFRKAAEQNYARAQVNLALCYHDGTGVRKDYAEGVKWLRKAAEQHYARAEDLLGQRYADGLGVPKNYEEAVNWYRKAATQNNPVAQFRLADCYYYGKGVPKNYIECYKWVLLSAAQGNQVARKNTPIVEKKMSPNQIAEGQRLARDFKPGEVPAAEAEVSEANHSEALPRASGTGSFITAASAATPQQETTTDAEWRVIKPEQLVAVDEKTLDLALNMMTSEDAEGLLALMEQGKAILSKGGHKVQLVNVHLHVFDVAKIEIRFKGDTHVYWAYVNALEDKG